MRVIHAIDVCTSENMHARTAYYIWSVIRSDSPKEPCTYTQKSPIYIQKSPVYTQKSFLYTPNSPGIYAQPTAFGVSFDFILRSQSNWSLFNGMWQKRRRELHD